MQTNTVRVNRETLLVKVRENRRGHRDEFLAAQKKYRERVIEELDRRLEQVRNGRAFDLAFRLPEPRDYTNEYDNAIAALEWDTRDEIELDQHTFNELVLNKWNWADQFAATTQVYTR